MRNSFKTLRTIVLCAVVLMSVTFTSCTDDEVGANERQFGVAINVMTESSNGLIVKSSDALSDQTDTDVLRAETPACVKTLEINAIAANGVANKVFTFTPAIVNTDIYIDDNTRANTPSGVTVDMNFWGGDNTVSAITTSVIETASSDPVVSEHDGISSNVCSHPIEDKTNATIYGVDSDVMAAFFDVYPVGTTGMITQGSPIQEDVKNVIRSIPPYAVFETTNVAFNVTDLENIPNQLTLDMTTQNSRMVVTARFDDGNSEIVRNGEGVNTSRISTDIEGGYYAEFIPTFNSIDGNGAGGNAPARTATDAEHQVAWFSWSNAQAVDGCSIDFIIKIYAPNGSLLKSIPVVSDDLKLTAGKDIWVDIIIPADVISGNTNNIVINYNWDNEDRTIVIGE